MKKFLSLFISFFVLSTGGYSVDAESSYRFNMPYDEVVNDRLEQSMPAPFSLNTAIYKTLVASNDFNETNSGNNLTNPSISGNNCYENGTIKIVKTDVESAVQINAKYTGEIEYGETYAFSCKIKTENLSGGAPRNMIQIYGENGWLRETNGYDGKDKLSGTNDWFEMVQIIQMPENATNVRLAAYLKASVTGTVWFDDFKFYRVAVDPLETIMKRPNYKGLIYGDGESDIELDITIGERTKYFNIENLALNIRLVDANNVCYRFSEAETLSGKMNFVFSSKGLKRGDYYLVTELYDKFSGDVISKKEQTIRKRAQDEKPNTYLDENGSVIRNGKKEFLKRIYSGSDNTNIAQNANDAGVKTIGYYGLWWALKDEARGQSTNESLAFLKANNMRAHISLAGYQFGNLTGNEANLFIKQQNDILPFFTQVANEYKNDSILDGYYIFDEPDPITEGEEIRWNNEILSEVDIDHPTYGVASRGYDYYGIYTKMTDILGVDPYPVTGKTDDEGISIDDLSQVGEVVRKTKSNFPNRPVYLVLQGFCYSERGDLRGPTEAELKNMAWQAICEGADGLDWYCYSKNEEWTNKLSAVFSDVAPYENMILSDEPAPSYTVNGGGEWLNIVLKRYNGKTYIFAVNNSHIAQNASVDVADANRYNLSFEPLEVKKIELTQENFLSPEAELLSIGFSNGKKTFATSLNDENTLYVDASSGVINYCAKVSENAKLFIGDKQVALSGKITVRNLDCFTVSVVSEDGNSRIVKKYKVIK